MDAEAAIPERVDLLNGESVGRYRVVQRLGSGAFGDVYKVEEDISGHYYAIKVLKLWTTDRKTRENLAKRFELEFETGQIESPNLAQSIDYGYIKGNPYIIMEFCSGGSLRDKILNEFPLEFDDVNRIAVEILYGLRALHLNGKTHRDLKPDNVLFDDRGRAKLTDFGISGHANIKIKLTDVDWRGKPKDPMGTWLYMPSEQINPRNRKETILPTIDIFAFGVVCYEMMTGHYPFGSLTVDNLDRDLARLTRRVLKGEWDKPANHGVQVPEMWNEVFANCFMPNFRDRFQNVDVILNILGARFTPVSNNEISGQSNIGLMIMQGEEHKRLYNLTDILGDRDRGILKIGRLDPTGTYRNDVAILEEETSYISRMHATVERGPEGWFIRDGQYGTKDNLSDWYESMNGTYVNGMEVHSHISTKLKENDIITLGNTTLKLVAC